MAWSSWCLVITQGQTDSTARGIPALSSDSVISAASDQADSYLPQMQALAFLLFIQSLQSLLSLCNLPGGSVFAMLFRLFSGLSPISSRFLIFSGSRHWEDSHREESSSIPGRRGHLRLAATVRFVHGGAQPQVRTLGVGASGLRGFGASGPSAQPGEVLR